MQTLEDLLSTLKPFEIVQYLQQKSIFVPAWDNVLRNEYDPTKHPVMNKGRYPDIVTKNGECTFVTRVTYDYQRLAVKRMTELIVGIPVRRIYKPETDKQREIARVMERIFTRNRIDAVNIHRCNQLYASCEIMTLWYAVNEPNNLYGLHSDIKMRCRTFSPMYGDNLYPLFDEYGDLIALSVGYTRKHGAKSVSYFDSYMKDRHIKFSNEKGWAIVEDEQITLGKIPAVYTFRPTPIWEDTSKLVYEMEWAMSRSGNYLRENSKPLFVVFADESISYGDEQSPDKEFKAVMQYPQGSSAQYITWQQAVDNLKYYMTELRQSFFTQLQLPDWSYESMKASPMSGESRKQLFIDAQLKVKDESGRLLEFFDREVNVIKAFTKAIMGAEYSDDIDSLEIENIITPYSITDEKDTINNLVLANGNKPLISQRESIEMLGWSDDVTKTMQEMDTENTKSLFEPTIE
jgi:hypothetical protein